MGKEGIGFRALIEESLLALRVNKARSLLTVLGIVIGAAAVIIMIDLGQGASASITNQIQKMGSNLLMIYPGASGAQVKGSGGTVNTLTWNDARAHCPLAGSRSCGPRGKHQRYCNLGQPDLGHRGDRDYTGRSPDFKPEYSKRPVF